MNQVLLLRNLYIINDNKIQENIVTNDMKQNKSLCFAYDLTGNLSIQGAMFANVPKHISAINNRCNYCE